MKQRYFTDLTGKFLLIFSFIFLFSTSGFSQEKSGSSNSSEVKPVHKSMSTSVQNTAANPSDTVSMRQRVRNIDDHLKAIQIKEDYIKGDQEEMKIATDSGWFEKMDKVRSDLLNERASLIEQLEKLH